MALASCGSLIPWPPTDKFFLACQSIGAPLFATGDNYRLDATRTKIAAVVQIPQSGNITGIAFALQAVTTDQQLRVGVYNMAADGTPDTASAYKGMVVGDDAITLATGSILEIALGTKCTSAVAGDFVAVVFEWTATQGDIRFAVFNKGQILDPLSHSVSRYASSTWSRADGFLMSLAFKYEDNTYASSTLISATTTTRTFDADTTPNEYGMKLVLPFKCRAVGIWSMFSVLTSSASATTLKLYDSGTNLLASGTFDNDAAAVNYGLGVIFSTAQTLTPGTYYVSAVPGSTSETIRFQEANMGTSGNAYLGAWPSGTACYTVNRSGGAWTEDNTAIVPIGLIIDQLDDGVADYTGYTLISGVAAAADVRNGTARYSGGDTGTLVVPAVSDVRVGVSVDATTGTLVVPGAASGSATLAKETGANARGGSGTCAKLTPTSAATYGYWDFYVPATSATAFTLKFWWKKSASGFDGLLKVSIWDTDGSAANSSESVDITAADTDYHQASLTPVTPTDTGLCRVRVEIKDGGTTGYLFIDDVTVT